MLKESRSLSSNSPPPGAYETSNFSVLRPKASVGGFSKAERNFDLVNYLKNNSLLKKNILALKYLKNANNVATFKPIEVSDSFKSLIEKFVMKGRKIDDSDFKALSVTEKRVLKRLYSFLKMDNNFDHNEDFQKQFQVMYGSFLAGNNNEDLIKQLKEYVKLAIHEAIISKAEGKKMLDKLNK